jgi:hypothetical protein
MDVPEPEELTQSPDDDKEFSRDSYLSPTFFSHARNCSLGQHLTINSTLPLSQAEIRGDNLRYRHYC